MAAINDLRELIPGQDLTCLAGTPFVYHCHHFNLFHDQTIEDALGEAAAVETKTRAAHDAFRQLLASAVAKLGAATPAERLELASSLFAWMGQGKLEVLAQPTGGTARGEHLHYSYAWREKYGDMVNRLAPLDAVAAGFAAAATEVAFDLAPGAISAEEVECYGLKAPACRFRLATVTTPAGVAAPVGRAEVEKAVTTPLEGLEEARISKIADGLRDFLANVAGDQRGLVQAFNVFVTAHLSGYYNQTAYDTILALEKRSQQSAAVAEELFGESGHVCVFNTFGNLLLSPEWEALVGAPSGEVEEIVGSCCAIARGLGFGHWTIAELVPGQRLILQTSGNYEAPFYLARYGRSARPRSYFFANAARAIMQLAHRVDWKARPRLDQELYQSLFRSGETWRIEQTKCLTRGDGLCEVVVQHG